MRIFSILLLVLFSTNLNAQPFTDIDKDNDGLIEVSNIEMLNAMRYQLDGSGLRWSTATEAITTGCAVGGCNGYELTRDLDFNDAASYQDFANMRLWTTSAGWQPIGNAEHPFTAIFKTNNSSTPNTIFNLRINRANESHMGLFGRIGSSAEISGIGLLAAEVAGHNQVGGLVGESAGGQISNSYVSGRVIGKGGEVGLLVGRSSGSITNSYANGEVSGEANGVGGLVGANRGEIANSYAMGSVVGGANNVGGLVGDNMQGKISNCYTTGNVSGSEDIGGLVGLSNLGTLVGNYVSGKASGTRYIGGLVGSNIGGTITRSYWDKTTSGLKSNSGGVGLLAIELQSASAQDADLSKPYYKWSTAHWDFGTAEQYPILKYAAGSDLENPSCGPEQTLPNCGTLLLGQHASLERILFLGNANLSPAFKPTGLNYQLGITTGTTSLQLIPITSNPDSTINISRNGVAIDNNLTSGTTSSVIPLNENTKITIEVSATNQRPAHYQLTTHYQRTITIAGIPEEATYEGESILLDATQGPETASDLWNYRWTQTTGKALLLSAPEREDAILWLHIPEDYVSATADYAPLGLTLEIKDGKETITKDITLTIAKINNGNIPLGPPVLNSREWTAPEIDLSKDPDGSGENFSYQWQSRTDEQDAQWVDINKATKKTYSLPFLAEPYNEYRVLINYIDGQGYKNIAASETARYTPKTTILDFIKGLASEITTPEDAKPQRTSQSTSTTETATVFNCSNDDIDDDNDGLIEICDLEGLNAMRYQMDGTGYRKSTSATKITTGCRTGGCNGYELMRDLDFNDDDSYSSTSNKVTWTTGAGWQPIGYRGSYPNYNNKPFNATFEGNNHTISNLMINRPGTDYVGLFGYTGNGTKIINVGLLNVNIKGRTSVGGLVGSSNYGDITNSYATGAIIGNSNVGGLVGSSNYSNITNSYATGFVTGENGVGGLAGWNWDEGNITNSYATGSVTGENGVGGLAGWNSGDITNSYATGANIGNSNVGGLVGSSSGDIANSYATGSVIGSLGDYSIYGHSVGGLAGGNSGRITNSYAMGSAGGNSLAGGLVGWNWKGKVMNSYATGSVTGENGVGGLAGWNNGGNITNSYATGSVEGRSSVGGLVGSSSGDIANSYATGSVTGRSDVGGLAGHSSGDIANSYWDMETSRITRSAGGFGKTTEQLQSPTAPGSTSTKIYYNWSTANWDFGTASQYPALRYVVGSDTNNPACRGKEDTTKDLPVCGSLLSPILRYGLSELRLTEGNLSPDFIVSVPNYVGTIVNKTNTIRLIPITINSNAKISIKVNEEMVDEDISSGTTGSEIQLNLNSTTKITIQVKNVGTVPAIAYTLYLSYHAFDGDVDKDDDGLIEIDSLEKLNAMRYQLDGSGYRKSEDSPKITAGCPYSSCNGYELIRDLDFDDDASYGVTPNKVTWTTDAGWQPIGSSYLDSFKAIFEGNNHTISNLMINRPNTNGVGLFGYTGERTKIANVGLLNVGIIGGYSVGGLVGSNSGEITNSYAMGNVTGSGNSVGGLVGDNGGNITNSHATGAVTGSGYSVGGLVGYNYHNGYIINSYAAGSVEGNGNYVGGLVGSSGGDITNSYAAGSVEGSDYVGGLVGNSSGDITNSYATGTVGGDGSYVGGLVGYSRSGTIRRSYWDTETSGIARSAGGIGKTTEQLQSLTDATGIYDEWSIANWDFGTSKQYPTLKYALGPDINACETEDTTKGLPVCGSLLSPILRYGLSELRLTEGNLSPDFIVSVPNYVGTIVNKTNTIRLIPIAINLSAKISIKVDEEMVDEDISSGTTSSAIQLTLDGTTKITIQVKNVRIASPIAYTLYLSYHAFNGDIDKDNDGLIEIDSLEKLNAMRYQLDGSGYRKSEDSPKITADCSEDGCNGYELIRNLDFDDDDSYSSTSNKVTWTTETGWQPIGSAANFFKAIFEGNNHTISNLMINRPNTNRVGLFGYTARGTKITNIGLLDVNIRGSRYVGGLVSWNNGNITNSYAMGSVAGNGNYVGGLVGYSSRGNITNSYAMGSVAGSGNSVGGLVGWNYYGGKITNSYATSDVEGSDGSVGGLVGSSVGEITNSYATGDVTGRNSNVGGLVGYNYMSDITNSYWDTKASGITTSAGGIGKTTEQLQSPTVPGSTSTEIYYNWSIKDWDFGTGKQYPILKYVLGPDTDNLACGTGGQPACGTLLPGQRFGPLDQLAVSPGTLSPPFDPQISDYEVTVNYDVDEITLSTTATDAAIRITSNTMEKEYSTSNTSSVTIPLTIAGNTIITIEATKDTRRATYILTVSHKNSNLPLPSESLTIKEYDELKLNVDDCGTRCEWAIPKALASLLPEGTSLRQERLDFGKIPANYLEVSETYRTFIITVGVRRNGGNVRKEITLKITKENNGSISSVGQLTLNGSKLTAPEIKLSDDPDGAGEITDYQWQRQSRNGNWVNVAGATEKTYTPNDAEKRESYRVQISYTDGQGYNTKVYSQAIRNIDTDDDGLIEISTLEELNAIRHQLDGTGYKKSESALIITTGCPDGGCKGYELIRDLDFNDDASYSSTSNKVTWTKGTGWQPIGYYEYYNNPNNKAFKATFEGNNHTISNLMINRPYTSGVGLFGYTEGGGTRIANVDLLNVDVEGRGIVGGLVGSSGGEITNSYATGTINGGYSVGGLVGSNSGNIMNSYVTGFVEGSKDVGGLVGSNSGEITNSYVAGFVEGSGNYVGGLVGDNIGNITNSYATGTVGGDSVGGLVGSNRGNITNSYATSFTGKGGGSVGGLVGWNGNDDGITNSYWDTETSGIMRSDGGIGKTTEQLKSPTTAIGIYDEWSTDNWDFGTASQYPVLRYVVGSDTNNPACRKKKDTTKDLPVCGSLLSPILRYGLSELRLTEGNLSPDFIVAAPNYIGTIVNKTSIIRLIPIATNSSATISIKVDEETVDEDIPSGTTSSEIQLNLNSTTKITIQVKNEGTASAIIYTLYLSYHAFDGDVDKDDDGLIEIDNLEKLNAMRHQPDGKRL